MCEPVLVQPPTFDIAFDTFNLAVIPTGKRPSQGIVATSSLGDKPHSRLFFIFDKNSGKRFLVDTGAEVSIFPQSLLEKSQFSSVGASKIQLQAVNHSPINTFGERSFTLDLGIATSVSLDFYCHRFEDAYIRKRIFLLTLVYSST